MYFSFASVTRSGHVAKERSGASWTRRFFCMYASMSPIRKCLGVCSRAWRVQGHRCNALSVCERCSRENLACAEIAIVRRSYPPPPRPSPPPPVGEGFFSVAYVSNSPRYASISCIQCVPVRFNVDFNEISSHILKRCANYYSRLESR